jgi:hypothetical protein
MAHTLRLAPWEAVTFLRLALRQTTRTFFSSQGTTDLFFLSEGTKSGNATGKGENLARNLSSCWDVARPGACGEFFVMGIGQ